MPSLRTIIKAVIIVIVCFITLQILNALFTRPQRQKELESHMAGISPTPSITPTQSKPIPFSAPPAPSVPSPSIEAAAESEKALARSQLKGAQEILNIKNKALANLRREKDDHSAKLMAYALEHKAVLAAAGVTVTGGIVALQDEKVSEEAKVLGGLAAIAGLIYGLSNYEEAKEVGDRVASDALIQENYNSQIKKLEDEVKKLEEEIRTLRLKI